jgi:hypothetical protein
MNSIRGVFKSPTFSTWFSFSTRIGSFFLIQPLIITSFSSTEISLWYLFNIFISYQMLLDFGLSPTVIRLISYGMAGSKNIENKQNKNEEPNWKLIAQIFSSFKYINNILILIWFLFISLIGTFSVNRLITLSAHSQSIWMVWLLLIFVTTISFFGLRYSIYFQGINKVYTLRNTEAIINSIYLMSAVFTVLLFKNFVLLLICMLFYKLVLVLVNSILLKRIFKRYNYSKVYQLEEKDLNIVKEIYRTSWRSGLGSLSSHGIIRLSGIIYAQFGSISMVSSYLLSLKLIDSIREFSSAPFYSRIPYFSQLFILKPRVELLKTVKKYMNISYFSFVVPFVILSIFIDPILSFIGSNTNIIEKHIWIVLGLAFFLERFGAMHLQLFTLSNKIVWHIANGISGILMLVLFYILFPFYQINSFPISMLISYGLFYIWYCVGKSYGFYNIEFKKFDLIIFIPYLLFLLIFSFYWIYN